MLALKLFDSTTPPFLQIALELIQEYNIGAEFALYHNQPEILLKNLHYIPKHSALHANHHSYGIRSLALNPNLAKQDLAFMEAIDCHKLIIHQDSNAKLIHNIPTMNSFSHLPDFLDEAYTVATYLNYRGITPYFEVTWESLEWIEAVYDCMMPLTSVSFGFCLDVGHALALSKPEKSLETWWQFAEKLQMAGIPLHYHCHVNDGSGDWHVPVHHGFEDTNMIQSAEFVMDKLLKDNSEDSLLVLETHIEGSINSLKYIKGLHELRSEQLAA